MKFLIFQHISCEHPGIFRQFFSESGIDWQAVELDTGDAIPDLDRFDALWVMGGPMDVWDTDTCPWLVAEKEAIRTWVQDLKKPYLGLCLGHQLLADALDGKCEVQDTPEIGILDVHLTDAAHNDPLMQGLTPQMKCLQWHSVRNPRPGPSCLQVHPTAPGRQCGSASTLGEFSSMLNCRIKPSASGARFRPMLQPWIRSRARER